MARIINYFFDHPYANEPGSDNGQIEVPDDATFDQINAEVRELFFNRYNYWWGEA